MKVLLLTNFYYPEKTGIGVTATDCARFLSELGHQVTVLTSMPYYPDWKVFDEYKNKFWTEEEIDGVKVLRVWLYVPGQPTTIKRIAHELSVAGLAFTRSLFLKTDLILCISPPLSLGFVSVVLSLIRRKNLWCYIKDIQPDAAVDLGMLRNPLIRKFSFWMEKCIYRRSEKILVLSQGMQRNIEAKGIEASKIAIVPDSVGVEELRGEIDTTGAKSRFREKYGLQSKYIVLYSGNLGIKHNVEIIAECARELQSHPDIFFAIVGEGAAKESVQNQIREYGLQNTDLFPLCERSDLGDMLSSADILLAPQRKEVLDIVVPSKLLAYLSSKKPVIASAHPESESGRMLRENKAGKVVEPENVAALVKEILYLKEHPDEAKALGEKAFTFLTSEFDHSVVKNRFYTPLFGRIQ